MERIDLLGYTMNYARREFEYLLQLSDFDTTEFKFEQLAEALSTVDVKSISADYGEGEPSAKFFPAFPVRQTWAGKNSRRSGIRPGSRRGKYGKP